MLHPSYTDLMAVVNSEVNEGEEPVVQSRYSIVIATAKRARQLIAGAAPIEPDKSGKALSIAVDELYKGEVHILGVDEDDEDEERILEMNQDVSALALDEDDEEIIYDDEPLDDDDSDDDDDDPDDEMEDEDA